MSKTSKFLWLFMALLYVGLGLYFVVYYRETIKNKVAYKSQAYITLQSNYSTLSGKYADLNSSYESRITTLENTIKTLSENAELEKNEAIQALVSDYEQQIRDIKVDYELKIRDLNNSTINLARQLIQGGLTELEIPEGVTEIRNDAFRGMSELVSVKLPTTLTKIGDYSFYNTGITSIDFPDSLTTIGVSAFVGSKLTSVTIPASVTLIGQCAFYLYPNPIKSVVIESAITTLNISTDSFINRDFCFERPVSFGREIGTIVRGFVRSDSILDSSRISYVYYYHDFKDTDIYFSDNGNLSDTLKDRFGDTGALKWYATMDDCLNNTNAYSAIDTLPSIGRYYARYVQVSDS